MRASYAGLKSIQSAADWLRRGAKDLRAFGRSAEPPRITALPPRQPEPDQWSRVSGILLQAQTRAGRAVETHLGASAQIDAATYALQCLRAEMQPAFRFTVSRPAPPAPTAFRREQFRRREPLAA